MITLILIIHIIVSVCLILIILLQVGRGASLSSLFGGGGGEAIFGGAGGDIFLRRLTVIFAILFVFTSLFLTIVSARRPPGTVIYREPSVPVEPQRETGEAIPQEVIPPVESSETAPGIPPK